ncbi:LysE family translocator [Paenibacillus agilis]|uniref:LysE family translocator n=1 Tax=Paenibacillus agilis TaxID=3020863 RepID=A0A559IYE4_9BACL|nr:LysE family transporter [Paenibacillus agilis]TVX92654.1 LysE family translocator [Paenibacillus agilis]
MTALLTGIIIGISIAAPVGPIGILCIRKTLAHGRAYGLAAGLGAALADALYGCIAAFGFTIVMQFLVSYSNWIQLIGAVFLLYLAYSTFRAPVRDQIDPESNNLGYMKTFGTTLLLTLTNPLTIISFIGIFAGMNITSSSESSFMLVLGVFTGSALWWLTLCSVVSLFKRMISVKSMKWINALSGLILLSFGMYSLYNACKGLIG